MPDTSANATLVEHITARFESLTATEKRAARVPLSFNRGWAGRSGLTGCPYGMGDAVKDGQLRFRQGRGNDL